MKSELYDISLGNSKVVCDEPITLPVAPMVAEYAVQELGYMTN